MKKVILFLWILFLSFTASADLYLVQNVQVSAMADSGVEAKEAALLQGSQQAFTDLLKKISFIQNAEELPVLAPEDVANLVRDVVINEEQTTALKYTGSLNFRFDKKAVQTFLEGQNIPFLTQEAPSFVFVPIWKENEQFMVFDENNPLSVAAKDLNHSDRLFQFQVPVVTDSEKELITPMVLDINNLSGLESLLNDYSADHVLWVFVEKKADIYRLQARIYPVDVSMGEQVDFTVLAHAENQELVAAQLLEKMLGQLEQNWRLFQIENQDKNQTFDVFVPVSDLDQWVRIQQKLKSVNGIEKYVIQSVQNHQIVLLISTKQSRIQLAHQLEQKGLLLILGENGQWRLMCEEDLKSPFESGQVL